MSTNCLSVVYVCFSVSEDSLIEKVSSSNANPCCIEDLKNKKKFCSECGCKFEEKITHKLREAYYKILLDEGTTEEKISSILKYCKNPFKGLIDKDLIVRTPSGFIIGKQIMKIYLDEDFDFRQMSFDDIAETRAIVEGWRVKLGVDSKIFLSLKSEMC